MVSPYDEYALHQVPLSMEHVATSDRNAYDRCIYQLIDPTGDTLMLTGIGIYPNLGTKDAYAAVRRGDLQTTVRASDALTGSRMNLAVGPMRVEVIEPLQTLRLVSEHPDLSYDLTWTAVSPAFEEPLHVMRGANKKVMLEGCRFAQSGSWSGSVQLSGDTIAVDNWIGTRDRSWGIRPVGEAEPAGKPHERGGFWWLWVPLRFDDYTVMVIVQEEVDGFRTLHEAIRVWHDDGRREQLGWVEPTITYRPGTRDPVHARFEFRGGFSIDIEPVTAISLSVGCGYGSDPEWNHGMWKGEGWVESLTHDYRDEAVRGKLPYTVIDHLARATASDGATGSGIFEHASIGRHDPSGFADFTSVAAS